MNSQPPILELFKLTKVYPTPKGPAVIVKEFNIIPHSS